MPNTQSQLYVHLVFAVLYKKSLISAEHRKKIEKNITETINSYGQKVVAIYAMPDHVHILMNYKPNINLAVLVNFIKVNSIEYINENKLNDRLFQWQVGYGAFSYSEKEYGRIKEVIMNQEEIHSIQTFKEEFMIMLLDHKVEYDENYLFEWIFE